MAKIRTLKACNLFQRMSYRDLAILASYLEEGKIKEGQWLVEQEEPSTGLIVIKEGKVTLGVDQASQAQVEIGPGDYFGELSLVLMDLEGEQVRGIGAKALETCEYLQIKPKDYVKLSEEFPEVAGKFAQGILAAVAEKMEITRQLLKEVVLKET